MPYSHTFEIVVNGINIEGEINFDQGLKSTFSTDSGETMAVVQHGSIQRFLEALEVLSQDCGEITKIEINKK